MTMPQLLAGMMYAAIFIAPCAFLAGVAVGDSLLWDKAIKAGKARYDAITGKREFI
jgi:hypothetical protein